MEPSNANPTFKITTHQTELPQKKLYFHAYLHHTPLGENKNQLGVARPDPKPDNSFGSVVINDWPMYDSHGPDAKIIARAQGQHIQSGMKEKCWYNSLNIVFEDERFKSSTLQVMGTIVEEGEWSIVGGTGEFAMARGIIYKKFLEQLTEGNIMELDVYAFYTPFSRENW